MKISGIWNSIFGKLAQIGKINIWSGQICQHFGNECVLFIEWEVHVFIRAKTFLSIAVYYDFEMKVSKFLIISSIFFWFMFMSFYFCLDDEMTFY